MAMADGNATNSTDDADEDANADANATSNPVAEALMKGEGSSTDALAPAAVLSQPSLAAA